MGLIGQVMNLVFGSGRNVIAQTAEVFRENAENAGIRTTAAQAAAMQQFAAEFAQPRQGVFDRLIDGLNRLPRPLLAFGTLGLFVAAMVDPIWFSSRMQGLALVPEPLWWLMGAIVSFYFGARHQAKGQAFQQSITQTMARTGAVAQNIKDLDSLRQMDEVAPAAPSAPENRNPALQDWEATHGS